MSGTAKEESSANEDVVMTETTDDGEENELKEFLKEYKLEEYLPVFVKQEIDFETLMLLTENDLKNLNLPIGPFRRLNVAIAKKKAELDSIDETAALLAGRENQNSSKSDISDLVVVDESGGEESDGVSPEKNKSPEIRRDHPYRPDLLRFKVPEKFLKKVEIPETESSLIRTPFELVVEENRLRNIVKLLRKESIICVELKYNEQTYEREMLWMQISTPTQDYLIDFVKMKKSVLLFTDIFVNPNILKVFFNAMEYIKVLQASWSLHTINVFSIKIGVKALNYKSTLFIDLMNTYTPYLKQTLADCILRPSIKSTREHLRKESHYLLRLYFKVRNELIDAGKLEQVLEQSNRPSMNIFYLNFPRKSETLFPDYKSLNVAQQQCADDLNLWRERVASAKNVNPNGILGGRSIRLISLSLTTNKADILSACDSDIARCQCPKILDIVTSAKQLYDTMEKDPTKMALQTYDFTKMMPAQKRKTAGTSPGSANPNAKRRKMRKPSFNTPPVVTNQPSFKPAPKTTFFLRPPNTNSSYFKPPTVVPRPFNASPFSPFVKGNEVGRRYPPSLLDTNFSNLPWAHSARFTQPPSFNNPPGYKY